MTDLTKIKTPFGLLDKETQDALEAHGGPYQVFLLDFPAGKGAWLATEYGIDSPHFTYRVAPQPFDWAPVWKALKDEYRWLAMDEDGVWFAYFTLPKMTTAKTGIWSDNGGCNSLIALDLPTDIAWEDSLMERPNG